MNVEDIDPVRLELDQAVPQRHVQGTFVISGVVDGLASSILRNSVACGKLGGDDHEITILLLLHPFAEPGLGLTILVVLAQVSNAKSTKASAYTACCVRLTLAVSIKFPPASSKASSNLKEFSLFIEPMKPFHASPMLMAPSCSGLTRMPARFARIRYRPSSVAGSGAGANSSFMVQNWKCCW